MPAVSAFRSDDETAVARLVMACERKAVADPSAGDLKDLVPYFDAASEMEAALAVQRKLATSSRTGGRKNNRSGSPGSDTQQQTAGASTLCAKGSRPVKAAKTTVPLRATVVSSSRSSVTLAASNISSGRPVPTVPAYTNNKAAKASAAAMAAACPGMFMKSPKPAHLPMPSSALLGRLSNMGFASQVFMASPVATLSIAVA